MGFIDGKKGVVDYRFLAKTTSLDQLIPITYILFLTNLQKRQTLRNGFAPIEKRYHNIFEIMSSFDILQKVQVLD